jgi:hypothetical protein
MNQLTGLDVQEASKEAPQGTHSLNFPDLKHPLETAVLLLPKFYGR